MGAANDISGLSPAEQEKILAKRAYSKQHYALNKPAYNPKRTEARIAHRNAIYDRHAVLRREAEVAKLKAKTKAESAKRRTAVYVQQRGEVSVPKKLSTQLFYLFAKHFANELPGNTRRCNRRGDRIPISAWMLGASTRAPSKIISVINGNYRYPWATYRASSQVLSDRIATRYELPEVQRFLLDIHIGQRYRNCDRIYLVAPHATEMRIIKDVCDKLKSSIYEIPLSAIIDPLVTNILLLIELQTLLTDRK